MIGFIEAENQRFAGLAPSGHMVVTFKVMPIPYTITYRVGTLAGGTGRDALRAAMQEVLDRLSGSDVGASVHAGKNPTHYMVSDFDRVPSFTLKNPVVVKNPEDPSEEWRFTGWSLGRDTTVVSRSRAVTGEYPTLELERSVGDLEFLANWETVRPPEPPTDPSHPGDPDHPRDPDRPRNPGHSGGSDHPTDPKQPTDPEQSTVPEQPADPEQPTVSEQITVPEQLTQLPDPNDPAAPEEITIWEDGVPKHYRKVWDPVREEWSYILDEDTPLTGLGVPKTDDDARSWGLISILLLLSLIVFRYMTCRKEKKDR